MSNIELVESMQEEIAELKRKLQRAESIRDAISSENKLLYGELHDLKVNRFARFNNEECWIYQGDGSDFLESLVCPVVIDPKTLIKLGAVV